MSRAIRIALLCCFGFACRSREMVYRAPYLDLRIIQERYVATQKTVHLVFYVNKNEIHEVEGVIKSANQKDGLLFEYFNSETHQLMQAVIPVQNIYEISVLETNYQKNKTIGQTIAIAFGLAFIVIISIQ